MSREVNRHCGVAAWLLPATFFSAIPAALSGSVLMIYSKSQYGAEDVFALMTSTWVMWRVVALWVVPMEFVATKRRLLLFFQGAAAAVVGGLSLVCWLGGQPVAVVSLAWALALLGASHDAVLDGLFVNELTERSQIKYAFVAPIFGSLGRIVMLGGLVSAVGRLGEGGTESGRDWGLGFAATAFVLLSIRFWQSRTLPDPVRDEVQADQTLVARSVAAVLEIGKKPALLRMLAVACLVALPASITSSAIFHFARSTEGATYRNSVDLYSIAAFPAFIIGLLGMLWILRHGLEKTFFKAVVFINASVVFALIAVTIGPEIDRRLLVVLLTLGNLPAQFAFLVSSLYIIQQVAPGRFSMSVHALAVAFLGLVTLAARYFADILQREAGFVAQLSVAALLGIASIALAKRAPFERRYREVPSGE